MTGAYVSGVRKAVSATALILAILFSVLARTSQADFWSPNFSVYGNTTIYGTNTNVTIAIDLPENKANNVTVAFTLKIFSSIEAPAGNVVNSTQYLTEHSQNLFDCYLSSGFILDYDRVRIIDTLWLSWSKSGNETYEKEYNELLLHNYDAVLSQTADSYYGNTVLPELSEGAHNLTVWVRAEQNYLSWDNPIWAAFSDTLTFNIDTTAPKVSVLSPRDSLYNNISDVPLNFIVSEPFSKTTYSLDGKENVTISGNTTLTGLPNGDHNVTVYATDEFGNTGASEIIYFTIAKAPEPFPAVPVAAASAATIAVVGAVLLLYFKKRKR
jgi:hypothetical protein